MSKPSATEPSIFKVKKSPPCNILSKSFKCWDVLSSKSSRNNSKDLAQISVSCFQSTSVVQGTLGWSVNCKWSQTGNLGIWLEASNSQSSSFRITRSSPCSYRQIPSAQLVTLARVWWSTTSASATLPTPQSAKTILYDMTHECSHVCIIHNNTTTPGKSVWVWRWGFVQQDLWGPNCN